MAYQTVTQFKIEAPDEGSISFLRNAANLVTHMTVKTVSKNGFNISATLIVAESMKIPSLNISVKLPTNREAIASHYYFPLATSEQFTYTGTGTGVDSTFVLFFPSVSAFNFKNTDFNILFNNINENRKSEYIYDVDRVSSAISPTNIESILNNSALPASVSDSNYTSLSNTTGRYIGSKTNLSSYGVEAAISGTTFQGSLYNTQTEAQYICSQSSADRTIEEFIYSPVPLLRGSSASELPEIRTEVILNIPAGPSGFTVAAPSTTSLTFHHTVDSTPFENVVAGSIITLENVVLSTTEAVKVITIDKVSSNTQTVVTVVRNYTYSDPPNTVATAFSNQETIVRRVIGDTIYKSENNKLYKVTSKYIWIRDLNSVYLIDEHGSLFEQELKCDIVAIYLN